MAVQVNLILMDELDKAVFINNVSVFIARTRSGVSDRPPPPLLRLEIQAKGANELRSISLFLAQLALGTYYDKMGHVHAWVKFSYQRKPVVCHLPENCPLQYQAVFRICCFVCMYQELR